MVAVFLPSVLGSGDSFDVDLPQNLSPGGYLIRHEIISLQGGVSMGGAEFYPMCTQVMIGGSGNGSPSPTVTFPGAYSDSDPGIYVPGVRLLFHYAVAFHAEYSQIYNPGFNYTFPGGPVANLAGTDASMASPWNGPTVFPSGTAVSADPAPTGGQSATGAPSAGASSTSTDEPSPSATPTGTNTGGTSCALKEGSDGMAGQKRHAKRFMRRAMHHGSR